MDRYRIALGKDLSKEEDIEFSHILADYGTVVSFESIGIPGSTDSYLVQRVTGVTGSAGTNEVIIKGIN